MSTRRRPAVEIVVASRNPVKIGAALGAFQRMFPDRSFTVRDVAVPSGVSSQPRSGRETLEGAEARTLAARERAPEAFYWVGIEGGVEETAAGLAAFAWVVVASSERTGRGRSGTFLLPDEVAALVRQGRELGEANDMLFQRVNSKQEEGAIGLLTGGVMDREELYEHAVLLALVPFKSPELYPAARER